jgi:hypothetical protein
VAFGHLARPKYSAVLYQKENRCIVLYQKENRQQRLL